MTAPAPIATTSFSHGTLGLRDAERTQRFYKEFLGLHSVRKSNGTQYVWLGGEWIIACLPTGKAPREKQGVENRWALQVATPAEVDAAHEAALAQKSAWDIQEVLPVCIEGEVRSFCLQDLDGNWWEIFHRPGHFYDDVFDQGKFAD
jgi:catechol 2,3-dioxygenase-like lactoylglutathione lyase family enzyme